MRHRRKLHHRYGRSSSGADTRALKVRGYAYWKSQPTLESGHHDNLKYDDGAHRVWVSRASLADYDGDRRAYMADRLTVEKLTGGRWEKV